MDLMDESGEIRVTAFKEQCDKFYDYAQVAEFDSSRVENIISCEHDPCSGRQGVLRGQLPSEGRQQAVLQAEQRVRAHLQGPRLHGACGGRSGRPHHRLQLHEDPGTPEVTEYT